jgi:predicted aspartyl protease
MCLALKSSSMSLFRVNIVAANIRDQQRVTPPIQALVDSGSELTWLPADVLGAAGISPVRTRSFKTAVGQTVQREVGYAILRAESYETIDEVVFGEASDAVLLGVRTLEGFGVMVDYIAHRFVATTTIVAATKNS